MAYILTMFLWLATVSRLFWRPLSACLWFLLILVLTPRYIGIGLGSDGVALTAKRLIILSFLVVLIVRPSLWKGVHEIRKHLMPIYVLIAFAFISCFGTVDHGVWYFSLLYLGENLAVLVVAVFIGWKLSVERYGLQDLFRYAFYIPLLISVCLVCVELLRSAPVLSGILEIDSTIATNKDFYFSHTLRDGVFRAKALFDGPLQLAEFSAYALSVLVVAKLFRLITLRNFIVLLGCVLVAMIATRTRSSLLIGSISTVVVVTMYLIRGGGGAGRILTWFGVGLCVSIGCLAIFFLVQEIQGDVSLYLIDDERQRSTVARLLQYKVVPQLVSETPVFGYGYQRNFVYLFDNLYSLDNYYLKVLLQSGYLGFTVFMVSMLLMLGSVLKAAFSPIRGVMIVGMVGVAVTTNFLLFKLLVSHEPNNMYLFIVFVFVVSRVALIKEDEAGKGFNRR